jgi:hypothetical protein
VRLTPKRRKPPEARRAKGGAPGRTRTSNPQIRSLMLYPIELRVHMGIKGAHASKPLAKYKQIHRIALKMGIIMNSAGVKLFYTFTLQKVMSF